MDSVKDTEITLGTTKLLGLFFGLVMVCAVFFALGYTLGRKSESGLSATSAAVPLSPTANGAKPAGAAASGTPMTFYKAVEQKDANAQLTPAVGSDSTAAGQTPAASSSSTAAQAAANNVPDPMAPAPTGVYFVQVAAVSKQDDAEALVEALRKKQYPAFVAANSTSDKLFHVQVGPFGDIKEAEGSRVKLINDGYNPILKK
jgi:cell division septation protein DedD